MSLIKKLMFLFLYLAPAFTQPTPPLATAMEEFAKENQSLLQRSAELSKRIQQLECQVTRIGESIRTTNTRIAYAQNVLVACAAVSAAWLIAEAVHYYFRHHKKGIHSRTQAKSSLITPDL